MKYAIRLYGASPLDYIDFKDTDTVKMVREKIEGKYEGLKLGNVVHYFATIKTKNVVHNFVDTKNDSDAMSEIAEKFGDTTLIFTPTNIGKGKMGDFFTRFYLIKLFYEHNVI